MLNELLKSASMSVYENYLQCVNRTIVYRQVVVKTMIQQFIFIISRKPVSSQNRVAGHNISDK